MFFPIVPLEISPVEAGNPVEARRGMTRRSLRAVENGIICLDHRWEDEDDGEDMLRKRDFFARLPLAL